jgi:hypothetical protein
MTSNASRRFRRIGAHSPQNLAFEKACIVNVSSMADVMIEEDKQLTQTAIKTGNMYYWSGERNIEKKSRGDKY